MQNNIPVQN